jgi:CBS domain-containing protein
MSAQPSPTSGTIERLARTSVRAAMQLGLFTCSPDDPLESVACTMAEQPIHCVVVAGIGRRSHSGEPLAWGLVSDLDLMAAFNAGAADATAGEIAGSDIVTVSPRDSLAVAVRLMTEHETAHLVVVSPDTGRPVGMLSTLDVARAAGGG